MYNNIKNFDNGNIKLALFSFGMALLLPSQCKKADDSYVEGIHLKYAYPSNKLPPEVILYEKNYDTISLFFTKPIL